MALLKGGLGVFVFSWLMSEGWCDNVTDKYPSGDFNTRSGRLITFNTKNDDFVELELAFNVPFLSIPIKHSLDMAHGAMANVNIGSVLVAAMMAFSFVFIVPAAASLLMKHDMKQQQPSGGYGGNGDAGADRDRYRTDPEASAMSTMWTLMANIDRALSEHHIDSTSCMQRAICWTVKNSSTNVTKGNPSSTDKIIDGLTTNGWIKSMVDGSVFQAAIETGLKGDNCTKVYKQCKINQKTIQAFGKQVMDAFYRK